MHLTLKTGTLRRAAVQDKASLWSLRLTSTWFRGLERCSSCIFDSRIERFGYPMNSSLPSMYIAGVMGALYFTASSGSSVMSITFQSRSGNSPFIPWRIETIFLWTSRGVQHEATRTSTFTGFTTASRAGCSCSYGFLRPPVQSLGRRCREI